MTFGEERIGRAYRVDVTGTYTYNAAYLENEHKKRDNRRVAEVCPTRSSSNCSRLTCFR